MFRLLSPHVYGYYLDIHLHTTHPGCQSANRCSCNPDVLAEHRAHGGSHHSYRGWTGEVSRHVSGRPVAFFADVSQETFVVKCAIYVLQTLLGDGVMIYRCYVVWKSVRIIILPCVMWCGVATFGVCWTYNYSQAGSNFGSIFTGETGHWVTAFLVFTLTANLLTTGLLAYRIWTIERSVAAIRSTKGKRPIIWVLVDATLLYSTALCSSLICFARSNNGLFVIGDMIVIIISIAFFMVFIRLAISKSNSGPPLDFARGGE